MSGAQQTPPARKRVMVAAGGAGAAAAMAAILAITTPAIEREEGMRLAPYLDPVKIWTECAGHTRNVDPKHINTLAECRGKLDADQRETILAEGRCTKVAVPIESFAAFTSFGFNAGAGTYCRKFAPLVNAGNLRGACAKLSLYVYAKGRWLPGLAARRARERALCERGLQ